MDALWMAGSCDLSTTAVASKDDAPELRRGLWTVDEDAVLADYVATHGEGRWNELARAARLRRTGKSCRLRWLNYLRPGVRRGDFTPREQLLILDLQSRWGNRWSKIAAHLPGRTDNEVKNYWRTRVQQHANRWSKMAAHLPGRTDNEVKNYWRTRVQQHAKQLGCDVGSRQFHDVMRHHWMPRLIERIHADFAAVKDVVTHLAMVPEPSLPAAYQNDALANNFAEQYASPEVSSVATGPSSSESSHGAQYQTNSPIIASPGDGHWSSSNQCQYDSRIDDDMYDSSWSELLARASCHDDADSTGALQDFGLGEIVDNFWSLDDISLQRLC